MTSELANPSKACCTIPPVETGAYTHKGEYKAHGGFDKAYITGPTGTGKAIVVVFDIFAYSPQTMKGADILTQVANALVVVPDFFNGNSLTPDLFQNPSEEIKRKMQEWFTMTGYYGKHIQPIFGASDALRADGYSKVGFIGYCLGGQVITIARRDASQVDSVVSMRPSSVEVSDAEGLAVPIALFPSKDEPREACDAFIKASETKPFASKNEYKVYETIHHGWAGARGNLNDEENLKRYIEVLTRSADFFTATLV